MAHDVFISYSEEDKGIADATCALLEARRIRCWIAPRDVQPGVPYPQSIMDGIRGSHVLVLILSAKSNTSKHVMREVERAVNCEIPIVPLRIEDVSLSGSLEYLVGPVHWLDALTPPLERHLKTLARVVQAMLVEFRAGESSARPQDKKKGLTEGRVDSAQAPRRATASEPPTPRRKAPEPRRKATSLTAERESSPLPPAKKLTNSLGMKLVRIEPGSFLMGSTKAQIDHLIRLFPDNAGHWFEDEQPQHAVKITRHFYLGAHQVTQGCYNTIMGSNPSHFTGADDLPVESVSWLDAIAFCNTLSEREKRTPFYRIDGTEVTILDGNGYRLPTEAEWEYACRAGSSTVYPFGDNASALGTFAWYTKNSKNKTHAVGRRLPNAWWIHDMLGNVWEWCVDCFDANYYASSPDADPAGASVYRASLRVYRGGCWNSSPRRARSAIRCGGLPALKLNTLGFRLALGHFDR